MKRNYIEKTAALVLMSAIVIMSGCADIDMDAPDADGAIRFGVAQEETSWGVKGGIGAGAAFQGEVAVLADRNGNVSIPLACIVEDGIGLNTSDHHTRGTLVNTTTQNDKHLSEFSTLVGAFKVSAYTQASASLLSGQQVTWADSKWNYTPIAYWPQKTSLKFYAYANLPESGSTVAVAATGQTLSHTVPAAAGKQTDIMLGYYSGNGGNDGIAKIQFEHPLTAVIFKVGTLASSVSMIKNVSLSGLATSGSVTMGTDGTVGTWSGVSSYTLNLSQSKESGFDVSSGVIGEPFIVIPQNLSEHNVVVSVLLTTTDKGDITVEAELKSGSWTAGKTNVYVIGYEADNVVMEMEEPNIVTDFGGSATEYEITSYYTQDGGETKIPVEVKMTYSTDGGQTWSETPPEWIHNRTISQPTGDDPVYRGELSADVQPRTPDDPTKAIISNIVGKKTDDSWKSTEDNRLDLSRGGETANCYIVNASGFFKIPLVYGNARKAGGDTDWDAIRPGGRNLKNYLGNNIGKMYIYEDVPGACSDAVLVWQDEPALLTNIKLDSDRHFIEFDIADNNAMQGNAVIAVRDGDGRIMWSWHIWVTEYVAHTDDRMMGKDGASVTYMDEFIGWCKPEHIKYGEDRTCVLKVSQDMKNGKFSYITFTQKSEEVDYKGNAPYYQHGRFAPEPPARGTADNKDKMIFAGSTEYNYTTFNDQASLSVAIQHPNVHYTHHTDSPDGNDHGWCSERDYTNYMWYGNKTVYDPSPVGYRVPNGGDDFWWVWGNVSAQRQGDGIYLQDWLNKQWSIHFPFLGQRKWYTGELINVTNDIAMWGYGTYDNIGVLGYSLFLKDGTGMAQGWTDTAASYIMKPRT